MISPKTSRIFNVPMAICAVLLAGCTTLSPQARQIKLVTNSQEVSACDRLGPVSTKTMRCVDPSTCMKAATAVGRNEAAEMGATHLLQTYNGSTLIHGIFDGMAYRCVEDRVGVQRMEMIEPEKDIRNMGCTTDSECKGNRICESGRCVSP